MTVADRRDRAALPPHTRGCTRHARGVRRVAAASPAHAGMYRLAVMAAAGSPRFPRTRGDVPNGSSRASLPAPLPPHTRGCTGARLGHAVAGPASPAHAGMYRRFTVKQSSPTGFPRTRGDVPIGMVRAARPPWLPPHTRGCTLQELAGEILRLSKMNWNTFDLYTKLPATLQSSGEIAKIGFLLQRFGAVSYD